MKNKNLLIPILMLGTFGILNTEMAVIGILPMIASTYNVDIVKAGYMVSFFAMGVAVAGPTMPLLFSRFPRKKVMLLVLGIFTVCNIISILAPKYELILAARVIPAFFHPVYCAMAFSLAAESVEREMRPKAVAKINIGVAAGMVIGVPISNFLAEQFTLSAAMAFLALVTGIAFLLTMFFIPEIPTAKALSYGKQLSVLKKPVVWASIAAVIFLNGSIFGVYNYLAAYLKDVTMMESSLIVILLFLYGICNVFGSYLSGHMLVKNPILTVKSFPVAVLILYLAFWLGGGTIALFTGIGIILWGILGGINGNINQYCLSKAVPDAPDFGNGLFLTAANVGCMTGTAFAGLFIHGFGLMEIMLAGMIYALCAGVIVFTQCKIWREIY